MGRDCRILFVCLGNICRSPLAEAIMRHQAGAARVAVSVDSAGTGDWHVGSPPDRRAIAVAAEHALDITGLRARQIDRADFARFDHIVALDRANLRDIHSIMPPDATPFLSLLFDHVPGREGQDVADPYLKGDKPAFQKAWDDISSGVEGLLAELSRAESVR